MDLPEKNQVKPADQSEEAKPSASPGPEDSDSDERKYMMFHRSDDEAGDEESAKNNNNSKKNQSGDSHHIIPTSPHHLQGQRASVSLRGRSSRPPPVTLPYRVGGSPISTTPNKLELKTSSGGVVEGVSQSSGGKGVSFGVSRSYEDHPADERVEQDASNGTNCVVITPANKFVKAGASSASTVYMYPPSSPIATGLDPNASPSPKSNDEELSTEGGEDWIPPPSNKGRVRHGASDEPQEVVLEARPEEERKPTAPIGIQPQFVRAKAAPQSHSPQRYRHPHPPLVVDSSHSNDSSDPRGGTIGSSLRGGRVQVVGGGIGREWNVPESNHPWALVSHSRSAESGASEEWEPPRSTLPVATPDREGPRQRRDARPPGYSGPPTPHYSRERPPPHDYTHGPPHAAYPPSYPPYEYYPYDSINGPPPPIQLSSSSHSSTGHPPGYMLPYTPDHYSRDRPPPREWQTPTTPSYPPRGPPHTDVRYDHAYGARYAYPPAHYPPPSYPPQSSSTDKDKKNEPAEEPHPLLKDYNPHRDGIRPQFRNVKKEEIDASEPTENSALETPSRKRRRRRKPTEKAAAAAAMAAAAAAAAAEAKERRARAFKQNASTDEGGKDETKVSSNKQENNDEGTDDELKKLDPGSDEDIPASKRAAMASAVALRAAAGGSPLEPPKSAAEVDFDIADPPLQPVHPPSSSPVLESATLMTENDVLCGRGGGTNSQMGNRRYRALVRDFQPTYLMARRREKPLMARSVVLVVRHRGGRFLRRDESDGRLYEVGDEKAEAKTSQALREGLDVRATKTAANTLLGTDGTKKRKRTPVPKEPVVAAKVETVKTEQEAPPAKLTSVPPSGHYRSRPPPRYPEPQVRPEYSAPPGAYGHSPYPHYPPPPQYEDPYYRGNHGYPYDYGPPTPSPHRAQYAPYPYPPPHSSAPGMHHAYPHSSPARSVHAQFSPPRNDTRRRQAQTPLTPVCSRIHP